MKIMIDKCDRSVLIQLLEDSKICNENVCSDTHCPLTEFCSKLFEILFKNEEE